MDHFESRLTQLATTSESAKLLLANWQYDKLLLGDGLQAVSATFPHFSRHDASHSRRIVSNIAQVLGCQRIEKLSPTDLWMILEAAHWHDVGMIVDDETARAWWNREEFRDHVEKLLESDDPRLAAAAAHVAEADTKALHQQYGSHWALELRKSVGFVLADYVRKHHARRSQQIVIEPGAVGLHSPRALIPARLFRWLADIALAHGRDSEATMLLPHRENGYETDLCHPRFVAFMLRLGDLLDLDNGRFCASLVHTVGELPPSSLHHVGKHAAIQRLLITPEKIEVRAKCADLNKTGLGIQKPISAYDIYEATESWLGWLRDELKFLNQWWSEIAPKHFGGAPGYGHITAELDGYELRDGRHPRFTVDSRALFQLVTGGNLYKTPGSAWLRELLANAKDASLLKAWSEEEEKHGAARALDVWQAMTDPIAEMETILRENFRIEIELSRITSSRQTGPKDDDDTGSRWRFSIRDRGAGIGPKDLKYLLTVGASSKRSRKHRNAGKKPSYWQPTGTFGIGMQSVFQITDQVVIRTHDATTHECREIRLNSPAPFPQKPEQRATRAWGAAYIRKLQSDEIREHKLHNPGTVVEFDVDIRNLPTFADRERGAEPDGEYDPLAMVKERTLFDLVSTPQPALWPAHWWWLMLTWQKSSLYELHVHSNEFGSRPGGLADKSDPSKQNAPSPGRAGDVPPTVTEAKNTWRYFDIDTSLRFTFGLTVETRGVQPHSFSYQGVDLLAFNRDSLTSELRNLLPRFPWEEIGVGIEWFEGTAAEYLRVDRDSLTQVGAAKLKESIKLALARVMHRYLVDLLAHMTPDQDSAVAELVSLFVHLFSGDVPGLYDDAAAYWRRHKPKFLVDEHGQPVSLGYLVESQNVLHLCIDRHLTHDKERLPERYRSEAPEEADGAPTNAEEPGLFVRVPRALKAASEEDWRKQSQQWLQQNDWLDQFVLEHYFVTKLGTKPFKKLGEPLRKQLVLSQGPTANEENTLAEFLKTLGVTEYRLTRKDTIGLGLQPSSVEQSEAYRQELALVFEHCPDVRATLPCLGKYSELEVDEAKLERVWHARGASILRPKMLCPFEIYEKSLELGHIKQYIEWVSKARRSTNQKLALEAIENTERDVAKATWAFIDAVHGMVNENRDGLFTGVDCDYSLPHVRERLQKRFNVDLPEPVKK